MSTPYDNYLKSSHWKAYRVTELERTNYRCEECGQGRAGGVTLEIHHVTYQYLRREHEHPGCTRVLCRPCHTDCHFPSRTWEQLEDEIAKLCNPRNADTPK